MDEHLIDRVKKTILEHIEEENFSVENLASQVGLSRSHLHRNIKKLTGKTATELITEIRLKKATELLQSTGYSIAEIAYKVGFNTPSYFNYVYKKYYRLSPGAVRTSITEPLVTFADRSIQNPKKKLFRGQSLRLYTIIVVLVLTVGLLSGYFFLQQRNVSVAVLPLNNYTGSPENKYIVEGLHDALIGELGRIGSIRVISRTSTLRYRKSELNLSQIAKELGVNKIVEGSVLKSGDSLRILIQLIDVYPAERHILAKDYNKSMAEVLSLQSDVVKDIARSINVKLTPNEQQFFQDDRKVNPETYRAYLRGMYHIKQGSEESFEIGMDYLKKAIQIDPGDPLAYAGLALGYTYTGHGQLSAEESFLKASAAIEKALQLDPTLDEAYVTLSNLYLYSTFDWDLADEAFKKALENNPNNEDAHAHYAWYHVLFNNQEAAIYHARQAVLIDPLSASYASWLGTLYYYNNNFELARQWSEKALEINSRTTYAKVTLAWISLAEGKTKEALTYANMLPQRTPHLKMLCGYIYMKAGERDKAMDLWEEMQKLSASNYVNPCYEGFMAAYLGYDNKAFELLQKAVDVKAFPIAYLNFYPCTENIRNDSRYVNLLNKLNLPTNTDLITQN